MIFTLRWIHYENLNKPCVDLFCKPFPNKLLGSYDNVCGINTWRVLKLSLLSSTLWHGQSRFEYHCIVKRKGFCMVIYLSFIHMNTGGKFPHFSYSLAFLFGSRWIFQETWGSTVSILCWCISHCSKVCCNLKNIHLQPK